ncbi:PTS sugar transporter subunit IIA [bacterium]|nr:PTS sugar transporter subunit IIA [bacterium]
MDFRDFRRCFFMKLSDALSANRVKLNLSSKNKTEVIEELIDTAVNANSIVDRCEFRNKVFEREKLKSTALSDGIAIPHAQSDSVKGICVCLGISRTGIEFDSLDGKPAHIILLIAAQEHLDAPYLSLLSRIVRIFSKAHIRQKVITAKSSQDIIHIIEDVEKLLTTVR